MLLFPERKMSVSTKARVFPFLWALITGKLQGFDHHFCYFCQYVYLLARKNICSLSEFVKIQVLLWTLNTKKYSRKHVYIVYFCVCKFWRGGKTRRNYRKCCFKIHSPLHSFKPLIFNVFLWQVLLPEVVVLTNPCWRLAGLTSNTRQRETAGLKLEEWPWT